jgi:hypothetical protein
MSKKLPFAASFQWLLVLVMVALVALIGWTIYRAQTPRPTTLDDVLSQLKTDADKDFTNVRFEQKPAWTAEGSPVSYNIVPGYMFAVSGVDQSKGLWLPFNPTGQPKTVKHIWLFNETIPAARTIDEVKTWIGYKLQSYGYTTTDHKTYYRHDATRCTVLNDPAKYAGNDFGVDSNLLEVSCFGQDVLSSAAAAMQPLVNEYLRAHPALQASDLTAGPLTIKSLNGAGVIGSSRTAGYDIAELVVTTKAKKQIALFYAKDASMTNGQNSGWKYVTEADDEFGFKCADMRADPDARKALYDQVCLGDKGQVKLDTNNRALQ